MLVYHDIVKGKGVVQQGSKKYVGEKSHPPQQEPILSHVAEVLCQADGASVIKGGWIGGDAWFGLINSCVKLKKRLDIHSTFIINTNTFNHKLDSFFFNCSTFDIIVFQIG